MDSTTAPDIGTLAVDTKTGRMGEVMDHAGGCVQLRPPGGGREWDADPGCLRPAEETERGRAA
ncbi:hypothetical protein [Streptomyces sp. ODS28]|uniref:hypothetical protein n=1 Tax=Streptomyces sp. ODS28 TaxID=3136688 RepID=UPI0031EC828B